MKAKDDLCHMCKFKKQKNSLFEVEPFMAIILPLKREKVFSEVAGGAVSANWKHKLWVVGWT